MQHQTKKLAVRYAIRPIAMVQIGYEDPHNAAPEPNQLFPMLFQTLVSDFSRGGIARVMNTRQVMQKVNSTLIGQQPPLWM